MTTTLEQALTMSLEELRERVDLAERLALASRLTPGSAYAGSATAVQPSALSSSSETRPSQPDPPKETAAAKKKRLEAEAAQAAAATAASSGTNTGGPTADELMNAMTPTDNAGGDAGAADLILETENDAGGLSDDDMLAGFSAETAEELSVPQLREAITAIATDIQTKRDTNRLTAVRGLLQKYGVQRVGELPDDKLAPFYAEAKSV